MTEFSISNGSPHRLLYDPGSVKYRVSNEWVVVPPESIANRVGIVGRGRSYVFFVPGAATNRSIEMEVAYRAQGEAEGLLAKFDFEPVLSGEKWCPEIPLSGHNPMKLRNG